MLIIKRAKRISQVTIYQSVLQKLPQLTSNEWAELDDFLNRLLEQKTQKKTKKTIAHLAGAWENWEEISFQDFLKETQHIRENFFASHNTNL